MGWGTFDSGQEVPLCNLIRHICQGLLANYSCHSGRKIVWRFHQNFYLPFSVSSNKMTLWSCWFKDYTQVSPKRPPLMQDKVVTFEKNQQNKPNCINGGLRNLSSGRLWESSWNSIWLINKMIIYKVFTYGRWLFTRSGCYERVDCIFLFSISVHLSGNLQGNSRAHFLRKIQD